MFQAPIIVKHWVCFDSLRKPELNLRESSELLPMFSGPKINKCESKEIKQKRHSEIKLFIVCSFSPLWDSAKVIGLRICRRGQEESWSVPLSGIRCRAPVIEQRLMQPAAMFPEASGELDPQSILRRLLQRTFRRTWRKARTNQWKRGESPSSIEIGTYIKSTGHSLKKKIPFTRL